MATNDFIPVAPGPGANVLTQTAYAASAAASTGYQSGVAPSAGVNKSLRQGTTMAAVVAQYIVDITGQNAVDDGTTATLLANLKGATLGRLARITVYNRVSGVQNISVDGGAPTPTGASTFTKLPSSTWAEVIVQGAGGGGGGALSNATNGAVSGGGVAGSCAVSRVLTSTITGQTVSVGAGGAGGIANTTAGVSGGASSIGSLITAPGGAPSGSAAPAVPPSVNGGGGLSSAPTGANLFAVSGGPGTFGLLLANNVGVGGPGGSSYFGPGPAGPSAVTSNGNDGINAGSGGSGCTSAVTNTGGATGGKGADGIIIIMEYN
jgi:hypothetical protein